MAEGIRVKTVDRDGAGVEGVQIDAFVAGYRAESVDNPTIGDPIRAAYCQPGATAETGGGDAIAQLPPTGNWKIVSERDASVGTVNRSIDYVLPSAVDPLSRETRTVVIFVARYHGEKHDWFGVQRYSLRRVENSAPPGNPVVVPLLHKRLLGPSPASTVLTAGSMGTPEFDQADEYTVTYGEATVYQTVPDAKYGSNNASHRLSIEVTAALQLPLLKYDGAGGRGRWEGKVLPTIDALDPVSHDRVSSEINPNGPFGGLFGDSSALSGAQLSFDLPENPSIDIGRESGENSQGGNRDRARNFRPRVIHPARYRDQALVTATIFGFRELLGIGSDSPLGFRSFPAPLHVTFPGSFSEQSLVEEQSGGDTTSTSAYLGAIGKGLSEAASATSPSGNPRKAPGQFKTGVLSSSFDTAANTVSLVNGLQSVFAEPDLNLVTDVGQAGPRNPNESDRLKAVVPPGEQPSPVATFSIPFSFRSGESSEDLTARGLWIATLQTNTRYLRADNQGEQDEPEETITPSARVRETVRVDAQTNPVQTGGVPR